MDALFTTALGDCLRSWRERLDPRDIGLSGGGARRVVGLRREEVAGLAGVSMDYLTRLEQGRATAPSASVLASLSRALMLSGAERDHLFQLAGQVPPGPEVIDTHIPAGVRRLMERLSDVPVLVTTVAREVVAANLLAAELFPEAVADGPRRERTLAWRRFTDMASSRMMSEAEIAEDERILVSELQSARARFPADGFVEALVTDLMDHSERFRALWAEHSLRCGHARKKRFLHPEVGELSLDCDELVVRGTDLTLVVFTAEPGSPSARALELIGLSRADIPEMA